MNKLEERAKKLSVIEMKETCPKCKKELSLNLAGYIYLSLTKGLVYQCPHCYCDFYISKIELTECKQ